SFRSTVPVLTVSAAGWLLAWTLMSTSLGRVGSEDDGPISHSRANPNAHARIPTRRVGIRDGPGTTERRAGARTGGRGGNRRRGRVRAPRRGLPAHDRDPRLHPLRQVLGRAAGARTGGRRGTAGRGAALRPTARDAVLGVRLVL